MKPIRLQIKKRITSQNDCGYSFESAVYINGQKLGHGVTSLKLDMPAGAKPKLTIECVPDEIDIDMPVEEVTVSLDGKTVAKGSFNSSKHDQ
ncbi:MULTISPECIES: hypothetical protein [Limosilactobacillus]|uniref:hypothetical protein n=1 Tax=Limosilactobacillus TaxID=2742598 RepID=UPI0011DCE6BA|nr:MULTISPECIES: hypothetical protein [Limosilactobacillus]WCT60446.1 hypothetical protein PRK60_07715 [Limosilactobacillus portuensis]DAT15789.1 MAG TPA: hypothetical protein [Caudoviricetes sp.]